MVIVFLGPATVILDASLRDGKLSFDVPPAPVALSLLDLKVGPRGRWAVTPKKCPSSRRWTTRARFAYTDGSVLRREASSPCKRH
jgi:hypothetical protein